MGRLVERPVLLHHGSTGRRSLGRWILDVLARRESWRVQSWAQCVPHSSLHESTPEGNLQRLLLEAFIHWHERQASDVSHRSLRRRQTPVCPVLSGSHTLYPSHSIMPRAVDRLSTRSESTLAGISTRYICAITQVMNFSRPLIEVHDRRLDDRRSGQV